ncbi:MAG: YjbQ family protein [Ardenticatenaceae bacterium]|nr:YjbQ family protein [Ardenticatenaceae bacterium]
MTFRFLRIPAGLAGRGRVDHNRQTDPARHYDHNARWGDGNGHSHVRAALLGPSLTVPFVGGRLTLGTWQQIIYVDFDNRPRQRELVAQLLGE